MSEELVSIITPVFNCREVLNETIESVVAQTYQNWELLLIDDKSTDGSDKIIKEWADVEDRIKPIFLDQNVGAGKSRNVGLKAVIGKYIAFLDSDDVWVEWKLEKQVDFLSMHNYQFIYSWYTEIDQKGNMLSTFVTPRRMSFKFLKYNNYILTSTVLINHSLLDGLQFPLIRKRQDWGFFLDLLKKSNFAYALEEVSVFYRKSSNSLSSNRWKLIKPNYLFFRDHIFNGSTFWASFHFLLFLPIYFHNKIFNTRKPRI